MVFQSIKGVKEGLKKGVLYFSGNYSYAELSKINVHNTTHIILSERRLI